MYLLNLRESWFSNNLRNLRIKNEDTAGRAPTVFIKGIASLFIILLLLGCVPRGSEGTTNVRRVQELKGDSLMVVNRYWEALPYYRHAWMLSETDEERAEISAKLYEVFYQAREWDSCVTQAEALSGTPWFDSLPHKGLVYWRAGRFNRILSIKDASPLLRAEAASGLGLTDSAAVLYADAEKILGEVARGRRAEIYAEAGKKNTAVVLLQNLKYPSNSQKRLLVELLFERKAWRDLPAAIARLPKESERLAALVRLYGEVGDQKKKRRTQMKLIRTAPLSYAARQAAKEITPADADETFAVARAYAGIDRERALALFEEAQAKGYSRSSCRWERAQLLYRLTRYDEAYKLLEDMRSDEARFLLAKVEIERGKTEDAMRILASVAEESRSKTNRQQAWERMATILQKQGKNLEAAELAAEGARALDDEELGHRALVLWLAEGDSLKARSALAGAVPLDSDVSLFFRTWLAPDSAQMLFSQLDAHDPFSYYSLTARGKLDRTPLLVDWFIQLGDTSCAISSKDSIIEKQAWALAEAGFFNEASSKLKTIKDPPLPVRFEWARRFSGLGADNIAIDWIERLLVEARKRGVRTRPIEALRLQYPTVYLFQIREQTDDPALFLALTRQESWFNPRAKSPANAYGLCQLLYSTARGMDTTATVDSLYLPNVSIRLGSEFLTMMRARFNGREVAYIAAYNAGPGAANKWIGYLPADDVLFTELIPYDETRRYVKQVLRGEVIYRSLLSAESHR
ncbi:MAG: lytic transglycosylase domain-containing protein [candidate division WOR-3 bacterium]|nr:lytic transglycosylase domain-containing protein [candidate division WOR-3 bacterium]